MELLEQFALGHLEAFEALFRQFQGEVYGWILRVVRDPAAAEELTVETFWRIYRAHARFDPSRSFGAWARSIAANVAIDHLKRRRPEDPLPENLAANPAADSAAQQQLRERVGQALRELPAKYQAVAVLALVEEKTYEEIGGALGISAGAVKSRVFRAVRMLRRKLRRLGIEP